MEASGAPMKVGIQATSGPETTKESPHPGQLPEGFQKQQLDLGADCPVQLGIGVPQEWSKSSMISGFVLLTQNQLEISAPSITISCTPLSVGGSTASWTSKRDYGFNEDGSKVIAEKTGSVSQGEYWSYQGLYGANEILSVDNQQTNVLGSIVDYQTNGRRITVTVEAKAPVSDDTGAQSLKKIMPTLTIDGEHIQPPAYK